MGVAVGVVAAEGHHRGGRADRGDEPLGIRRPAVMGHLEHLGTQPAGLLEQAPLGVGVAVTGQQHAAVLAADAQHHRAAVAVGVGRHAWWRGQHLHHAGAQREPHARVHTDDRYPPGAGDGKGLHRAAGQRVRRRTRPGGHEQRGDVQAPQHVGESAGVVVVTMGQHDGVERPDAAP